MKKIISLILMLCMLPVNMVCIAEETDRYVAKGDFLYDVQTNEIMGYYGSSPDIVIPAGSVVGAGFRFYDSRRIFSDGIYDYVTVNSLTVSENVTLRSSLSLDKANIKEIMFYNTAQEMPRELFSFQGHNRLERVKLPDGLEEIRTDAFQGCTSLTEVIIPDSVKSIGQRAFYGCSALRELELPEGVTSIGNHAIFGCDSLEKLIIPDSVTEMDLYIGSCEQLKEVRLPECAYGTKVPHSVERVTFAKEPKKTRAFYRSFLNTIWGQKTLLSGIKGDFLIVDGYLIKYVGSDKNVIIPDGVKYIDEKAFEGSDIETVQIPDSVVEILGRAFYVCKNLKEVTIPAKVTVVKSYAFANCDSLAKLTIEGTTLLEGNAFYYCYRLTDEGITVNGRIRYEKEGYENGTELIGFDPFCMTSAPSYSTEGELYSSPSKPTASPTAKPTASPAASATASPTGSPTASPTAKPTPSASAEPSPTAEPTARPKELTELTVKSENGSVLILAGDQLIAFPDAKPFIDGNSRTLAPVRAIAQTLGAAVEWNDQEKTAVITKDQKIIRIVIGETAMEVDHETVVMETAAQIIEGRTYIPVRFIGEALGLTVHWAG